MVSRIDGVCEQIGPSLMCPPAFSYANALLIPRMSYILVIENERDDPMELPCEDDGSLLLSTLIAQFPEATGLKYKNPETGAFRGIRLNEGRLYAPTDSGWGKEKFQVVFPKASKYKSSKSLSFL